MKKLSIIFFAFLLIACDKTQPVEVPAAQTLTREASGYYCLMTVLNYNGPKGQIMPTDKEQAVWFTSARDTIAFHMAPYRP